MVVQLLPDTTNLLLQLWDECLILQEELDKEQKQMRFFQLEGDQAQRSWEASKRRLEETRARMRETLRRKQEAEECHRAEIQVCFESSSCPV